MRELCEAHKSGRPGAIAEILRKRQREREETEKVKNNPKRG
jgi:hypothetical protein